MRECNLTIESPSIAMLRKFFLTSPIDDEALSVKEIYPHEDGVVILTAGSKTNWRHFVKTEEI